MIFICYRTSKYGSFFMHVTRIGTQVFVVQKLSGRENSYILSVEKTASLPPERRKKGVFMDNNFPEDIAKALGAEAEQTIRRLVEIADDHGMNREFCIRLFAEVFATSIRDFPFADFQKNVQEG